MAEAKKKQEEELERLHQITTTPPSIHVTENVNDEGEEGQLEGATDFSLEGVSNVGSELERVHITEKNKSMAAKLKVLVGFMIDLYTWSFTENCLAKTVCLCVGTYVSVTPM